MNSFWRDNHIDQIYSIYDYDPQAAVNNFGVNDSYMFDFGLQQLESRAQENKPFFASFLTVSNHGPFIVPDAYVGRAANPQEQIIAYADDAIKHFVESAQQTQWGENTLFILVADHGANLPCPYEMVLPYHKIPVYIFGAGITPWIVSQPTSQIDIWPTVLSMLGIDYNNNSLGIDILHNHRPYAFFVSDDYLGVSDGEYFWCYGIQTQREVLYRMGSGENILTEEPERATEMRTFGMNMQRVNLMAIDNKWTEPCE
jgi:phosphoglycerol transferase MdoB-like AlkP superfamily enzyme